MPNFAVGPPSASGHSTERDIKIKEANQVHILEPAIGSTSADEHVMLRKATSGIRNLYIEVRVHGSLFQV